MMMKNLLTKSVLISLLSGTMIFGHEISDYNSERDREGALRVFNAHYSRLNLFRDPFFYQTIKFAFRYPIFLSLMMGIKPLKVLRVNKEIVALAECYPDGKYRTDVFLRIDYGKNDQEIKDGVKALMQNVIDELAKGKMETIFFEVNNNDTDTKELMKKIGLKEKSPLLPWSYIRFHVLDTKLEKKKKERLKRNLQEAQEDVDELIVPPIL